MQFEGNVLTNDYDADEPDRGRLTAVIEDRMNMPADFAPNPDGSFSFTPAADFVGDLTFKYAPSDGVTKGAETLVTTHVQNTAPVGVIDFIPYSGGSSFTIAVNDLVVNDKDSEGDTISIASVQDATNGSVELVNLDGDPVHPRRDRPDTPIREI